MILLPLFLLALSPLLGFSYHRSSEGFFTSAHILIVDPSEETIALTSANKRETLLSFVKKHGALAGVNGSFWKEDGNSSVPLKIEGKWLKRSKKPFAALGWSEGGLNAEIGMIPLDRWNSFSNLIGGIPLLVKEGKYASDFRSLPYRDSFKMMRHPRTAVGLTAEGKWILVVVEGSFFNQLGGMTLSELADLMIRLGATSAINLDGGDSSTMVVGKRIVNLTMGDQNEEGRSVRAVSNALLLLPRASPANK